MYVPAFTIARSDLASLSSYISQEAGTVQSDVYFHLTSTQPFWTFLIPFTVETLQ